MSSVPKNIEQSLWIYSQLVPLLHMKNKKNGNEHMMQCPFCDEAHTSHKKSAMRGYYYIDTQSYYCFRCDKYASALELYEKLSGLDRKGILSEYKSFVRTNGSNRRGVNFSNFLSVSGQPAQDDAIEEISFDSVPETMRNPLTERGRKYLEGRNIFKSKNIPGYNTFYSAFFRKKYEVVVIPWYMEGQECYYQWRFIDSDVPFPKYGFPKGLTKKVYGIDMIDPSFPYIICTEGVFDSLWVKNGVALGGKHLTDLQRRILTEKFPKHKIVYAFDNDKHGINSMIKQSSDDPNALIFFWKNISNGAKDLNEFAMTVSTDHFFNPDNVSECICSPLNLKWKLLGNGV